jgi:hypothetical protein
MTGRKNVPKKCLAASVWETNPQHSQNYRNLAAIRPGTGTSVHFFARRLCSSGKSQVITPFASWGEFLGQRSEKTFRKPLFISVLGRGFINPDLKTVYNGPGDYKQGPTSAPMKKNVKSSVITFNDFPPVQF